MFEDDEIIVTEEVEELSDAGEEAEESGDTPEDIEKARKYGYKTPEEYDGNPKWRVSAKEYLQRQEKGGMIKKLESDITEMKSAFEKMQQFTKLQVQTAREKALEDLRTKQIKAIDDDGIPAADAFKAYEKEKVEVEKKYSTEEPKEEKTTKDAPEIETFYRENPWYHDDVIMQGAANALHRDIVTKHPTMPLAQQLDMVKRKIVENFPGKFENPKKKTQSIETGSNASVHSNPVRKKDTFESLGFTAHDIADARKLIKGGVFKDEADFIASYNLLNKGKK